MSGVRPRPIANPVATPPGHTFVHRTPCGRSSWSSARVNPTCANFDAQYTASNGSPRRPASDASVTTSARLAPQQVRERRADGVQRPLHVDVDDLLQLLRPAAPGTGRRRRRRRSRRRCRARRIARRPRRVRRLDRRRVPHVARARDGAPSIPRSAPLRDASPSRTPCVRERRAHRGPDPPARPRDERHLALQPLHRSLLRSRAPAGRMPWVRSTRSIARRGSVSKAAGRGRYVEGSWVREGFAVPGGVVALRTSRLTSAGVSRFAAAASSHANTSAPHPERGHADHVAALRTPEHARSPASSSA